MILSKDEQRIVALRQQLDEEPRKRITAER